LLTPGVAQDPRGLTSASNRRSRVRGIRGFQSSYPVGGGDNNNAFNPLNRDNQRAQITQDGW